jgi:hypothetical protein
LHLKAGQAKTLINLDEGLAALSLLLCRDFGYSSCRTIAACGSRRIEYNRMGIHAKGIAPVKGAQIGKATDV